MAKRVSLPSSRSTAILGMLGTTYFLAAASLLVYSVITNWGAMGGVEWMINALLFGIAAVSAVLVSAAAVNLKIRERISRGPRDHRAVSAVRS